MRSTSTRERCFESHQFRIVVASNFALLIPLIIFGCVGDRRLTDQLAEERQETMKSHTMHVSESGALPIVACWWSLSDSIRFVIFEDGTIFWKKSLDDRASSLMKGSLENEQLERLKRQIVELQVTSLPSFENRHIHTEWHEMAMLVTSGSSQYLLKHDTFGREKESLVRFWGEMDSIVTDLVPKDEVPCDFEMLVPKEVAETARIASGRQEKLLKWTAQ